jgi:hypothetical protein
MFNAALISLSSGQSYANVRVFQKEDFDEHGITQLFGPCTVAFYADKELLLSHPWNVCLIHLDRHQRAGRNAMYVKRLVTSGDANYDNCAIIPEADWEDLGIPNLFDDPDTVVVDQIAFSCSEGVFITYDANVLSIVVGKPERRGIRTARLCDHSAPDGVS